MNNYLNNELEDIDVHYVTVLSMPLDLMETLFVGASVIGIFVMKI